MISSKIGKHFTALRCPPWVSPQNVYFPPRNVFLITLNIVVMFRVENVTILYIAIDTEMIFLELGRNTD